MTDANIMKAGRLALGLSQTEMARALHFQGRHAGQQVSRIERGERPLMPDKKALLNALLADNGETAKVPGKDE